MWIGKEASFSGEMNVDVDIIGQMVSPYLTEQTKKFSVSFTTYVQNRKHRKKRINKKWQKRYGYTPVRVVLENLDARWIDNYTVELERRTDDEQQN